MIETKAREAARAWDSMVAAAIRLREPCVRVEVFMTLDGRKVVVREGHVVRMRGLVFLTEGEAGRETVIQLEDLV